MRAPHHANGAAGLELEEVVRRDWDAVPERHQAGAVQVAVRMHQQAACAAPLSMPSSWLVEAK